MAISADRERLLRSYAAGDISWTSLRGRGIENYRDVLAGLGELGLLEGPNVEARRRGREVLREALKNVRSDRVDGSACSSQMRRP